MTVINLSRRIEKLEAARGVFNVSTMTDAELEAKMADLNGQIAAMIADAGGKDAVIADLQRTGAAPAEIAYLQEWSA